MSTDSEFALAEQRAKDLYERTPHAIAATYVAAMERLIISLNNGLEISVPKSQEPFLCQAAPAELQEIEINAGGLEVYFPRLDEAFWVPYLVEDLQQVRRPVVVQKRSSPEAAKDAHAA